jgi:hypothetical protein
MAHTILMTLITSWATYTNALRVETVVEGTHTGARDTDIIIRLRARIVTADAIRLRRVGAHTSIAFTNNMALIQRLADNCFSDAPVLDGTSTLASSTHIHDCVGPGIIAHGVVLLQARDTYTVHTHTLLLTIMRRGALDVVAQRRARGQCGVAFTLSSASTVQLAFEAMGPGLGERIGTKTIDTLSCHTTPAS